MGYEKVAVLHYNQEGSYTTEIIKEAQLDDELRDIDDLELDIEVEDAKAIIAKAEKEAEEMDFWTKEEFLKVIDAMMDSPIHYYAYEMLYWCGIREGELFALTPADFDFENRTVSINKSYQRIKGQDVITTPKTKKSIRVIQMPQFLADEIQDYIGMLYGAESDTRIFQMSKHSLKRAMEKACKTTGVKVIRVHDLRHSHVSLLIDMGFSALAIAERVGHESIDITYRYAHLFPTRQTEMANKLDLERLQEGA